jgi:importin subunit alpha-1
MHSQLFLQTGFIPRLVELLSSAHTDLHTPALRAIGNLVTGTDAQTQTVMDSGVLNTFRALLKSPRENVRKETAWYVMVLFVSFLIISVGSLYSAIMV